MIREIRTGGDISVLDVEFTNGLGRFTFSHPSGTFSLTPASRILLQAIIDHKDKLSGIGLDWGSGIGCLAILAAKISSVQIVYGLEISKENVETAKKNSQLNSVDNKVYFMLSDSYSPFEEKDKKEIQQLRGKVSFIVSNPPSSDWDDGFGYRRIVLDGAKEFLKKGGIVLLNVSFQYGEKRVESLYKNSCDLEYLGLAASTGCVQFDLKRPDLLDCLKIYAEEESKGGYEYSFIKDINNESGYINARTALKNYIESGIIPFTKWQTHMFKYIG